MKSPTTFILGAVTCLLVTSSTVFAQATIAGVVRDSSGAVLPGVIVEATSPSLTEKVRTAVTDGTGQYRIVTLPPGQYLVTFALTGGRPVAMRAGNVMSEPPPAKPLTMPAATPATTSRAAS